LFLLVVASTALGIALAVSGAASDGVAVFVLVASGWVLSLIFHEFAHAYVAWKGGDHSIAAKGYLSLDPRKYTDPLTSLVIPIILVLAGGIGLPGGAVWINRGALRSKGVAAMVSLAGPLTNLIFATVCLVPISVGVVDPNENLALAAGLTFLGFLQITAFVLNLLPIPGLDGFGAIEPFLPDHVLIALAPVRRYGLMAMFVLLWFVAPVRNAFWDLVGWFLRAFGVDSNLFRVGFELFKFWE
jgi:Zn-dependent protease